MSTFAWLKRSNEPDYYNQSLHTPTCSIEGIVVVLTVTVGEAAGARLYTRVCIQGFRQLGSPAAYRWQRFCFVADGWRRLLLFLQDTSSKDYAQQARLCSDLAYVYNSFAKVAVSDGMRKLSWQQRAACHDVIPYNGPIKHLCINWLQTVKWHPCSAGFMLTAPVLWCDLIHVRTSLVQF